MAKRSTKLLDVTPKAPAGFRSLVTPTYRGSTTLFATAEAVTDTWNHDEAAYTYGLFGTPTSLELAARIAELEGAHKTVLTPGGLAAITLVFFTFAASGAHVLIPDTAYGPTRGFAGDVLARFGVDVEYYPPLIGANIAASIRPNTRLIWCESPGSITMEIEDVPAIVRAARERDVIVALDNTYSAGVYFDAFAHGVDISIQAVTKYIGGHSDLLLGSVSARDGRLFAKIGKTHARLGLGVSPDDCSLALRGLQTLYVRLDAIERSALAVARRLAERPEIETVLHPALPSCPGHEHWKRDFTGSSGLFSIVFPAHVERKAIQAFIDRLEYFSIGYSWGGVASLAVPYFDVKRAAYAYAGRLVRLHVGLADPADLIADLERALEGVGTG